MKIAQQTSNSFIILFRVQIRRKQKKHGNDDNNAQSVKKRALKIIIQENGKTSTIFR